MVGKRSWAKAHSPYWSMHVEAWRQSGLNRTEYCRQHGLSKNTFDKWMKHLIREEDARKHKEYLAELRRKESREAREKRLRKRARMRFAVSAETRGKALQAFWAMHVEAMNWSGMGVREYAASLQLSPTSLRKWRDRLEDSEEEVDWRAHLHPSARPVVSTSANGMAPKSCWTDARKDDPPLPRQPVRRFFSDEEKHAIALESDQPGVSVSAVARKHGIVTGMLFRWRVQFGIAQKKRARLASVANADKPESTAVLHDLLQPPDGMMVFDLADGRQVFAPEGSDPDAVRAHVTAQETGT
ncbi:IS66 family insertion sequence element accessory protein TnpA [Phyllobacterium leguminum]|uniref:Transposase n=1 Tax=Phyllobacterium leguminum TaxID=314237 RepID=A0A318SZH5_9HYPH|nr:transposase [Phyllobacterium leguminum]PYE85187.1 transposase [Phyllobacterium leguminum]